MSNCKNYISKSSKKCFLPKNASKAKNVLLALLAGDDEEIPNEAVLQVLAIREILSKKMSMAKVSKVPQQHHQHLMVLFVDFSFH